MDLSFLPDQDSQEDHQKFSDTCYTVKQGMTINRLFNLIMTEHLSDHSDFIHDLEDEWFNRRF